MNIAILGCGYLGTHLAKFWHQKNHSITAMTDDPTKVSVLNPFTQKIVLLKNGDKNQVTPIIEQNETIILSISSERKKSYADYLLGAANVIKEAAKSIREPKYLLFTGRTTIYNEKNGLWLDEESTLDPVEDIEKKLFETEQILLSLQELSWDVCILRIGEVYGPNYEISQKIKNKSDYFSAGSGNSFTNMIHLDDIIGAINFILDHHLTGIYNLVDDDHQTLKKLLNEASTKLNLPDIQWEPKHAQKTRKNFRASNHKIKSAGYSFIHPHRIIN